MVLQQLSFQILNVFKSAFCCNLEKFIVFWFSKTAHRLFSKVFSSWNLRLFLSINVFYPYMSSESLFRDVTRSKRYARSPSILRTRRQCGCTLTHDRLSHHTSTVRDLISILFVFLCCEISIVLLYICRNTVDYFDFDDFDWTHV